MKYYFTVLLYLRNPANKTTRIWHICNSDSRYFCVFYTNTAWCHDTWFRKIQLHLKQILRKCQFKLLGQTCADAGLLPAAACLHVNVGVPCLVVLMNSRVCLREQLCVLLLCMHLPACLFFLIVCMQPMRTMGLMNSFASRRKALLSRHIIHPTKSSIVYKTHLHGAQRRDRTLCHLCPPWQLELLFFLTRICLLLFVLFILFLWCLFLTEWGEVSVGGKCLPTHKLSVLFNFLFSNWTC